jgi:hypothetical protein
LAPPDSTSAISGSLFCSAILRAQTLLQAHGRHGAALDGAVAGADQHALARHLADAHDGAAAQHGLLAVVVVHAQAGQGAEFQEAAAPVEQARHALTRQQLALRAKSLGTPLSEIKHYLDMYGQRGEGRIQQLTYVIEKTDAAIAELEAKRAQIDTALAELRFINARSRQTLVDKQHEDSGTP